MRGMPFLLTLSMPSTKACSLGLCPLDLGSGLCHTATSRYFNYPFDHRTYTLIFLDVGSSMPLAHLVDSACPCSVGRPKHMRVMAGALEGDLFIGPKAEVTPVEPAFAWVWGLHSPGSIGWWSELSLLRGHLFSGAICQASSWALTAPGWKY